MKDVVLHIGFHKTASTWWQKRVFPLMEDINFIHKKNLFEILETSLTDDKINIISHERLSGFSHNPNYSHDNRTQLISNLSKIYPDAKVILCIRDKDDWLRSAHKQYSYSTQAFSFDEYSQMFDDRMFDYDNFIDELKSNFPKGVFVFKFEEFLKNKKKFVSNVCDFIGCKDVSEDVDYSRVNQAVSNRIVSFFYFLDNYLFKSRKLHTLFYRIIRLINKKKYS